MAMQQHYPFVRNDVMPSFWANAIQNFLSTLSGNFQLRQASATTIQVAAGPADQAAAVPVEGMWRWVEASVTRAHPGGAAGLYDVWVTALDNDIVNAPDPLTDATNYAFSLAITAAGARPILVPGSVEIMRHVGLLTWDGRAITALAPTVGQLAGVVADTDPRLTNMRTPSDGSVTAAKLAERAVTNGKLGDASVNGAKIADGVVIGRHIGNQAVQSGHIADGTIAVGDLSTNAQLSFARAPGLRFSGILETSYVTLNPGELMGWHVYHWLNVSNPIFVTPVGAVHGSAVNNPADCVWVRIYDDRTVNSAVLYIRNLGSAAANVHWRGFFIGWD